MKTITANDDLMAAAEAIDTGPPTAEQQAQQEDQASQEQAAQKAMADIGETVAKMAYAGLKALRSRIAKKLPEIVQEWPDDMLKAPAGAVVPVFERYAETLFKGMGQYPELGMLAFSALPLVMGYMAAAEKQSARTVDAAKDE